MEKFEIFCAGDVCPLKENCRLNIENIQENQIEKFTGTLPSQYDQDQKTCCKFKPFIYPKLYGWLQKEFYYSNHPKYKKYFEEWISNITIDQVDGFEKQMIGQIEKSKVYNG